MDKPVNVQEILVSVPEYMQKVSCDTTENTLPFKCAVITCPNSFHKFKENINYPYKFHKFPAAYDQCLIWKKLCGLNADTDTSNLMVCSDHFDLDDYLRNYKEEFTNPNFKRVLHPKAIPKKKLCPSYFSTNELENRVVSENIFSNNSNSDVSELKHALEQNHNLKRELQKLLNQQNEIEKKIFVYDTKIAEANKDLKELRSTVTLKNRVNKNLLHKVFSKAQINLLLGKKRVVWSNDDLASALTLRHLAGRECYLYMKNTLNIPLPALSCVQKWACSSI